MILSFSLSDFFRFPDDVASSLGIGEKLRTILSTALGGYLLVFIVLGLIWGILELFGVFIQKSQKQKTLIPSSPAPAVSQPSAPPIPTPSLPEEASDDTETVAAIAAAIAAYTGRPAESFRVVSFRKREPR